MTLSLTSTGITGDSPLVSTLTLSVEEADVNLPSRRFSGTVLWGDSTSTDFAGVGSGIFTFVHGYVVPGLYAVSATVRNARYPVNDIASSYVFVTVLSASQLPIQPAILVGPILPLNDPDSWQLDLGEDERVLASDLKLILLTSRGERLMNPSFGTDLRSLIFDPIIGTEDNIKAEITQAVSSQEPRVKIENIQVQYGDKSATVVIYFSSRLSSRILGVSLPFFKA